jgi:hypothetical protein
MGAEQSSKSRRTRVSLFSLVCPGNSAAREPAHWCLSLVEDLLHSAAAQSNTNASIATNIHRYSRPAPTAFSVAQICSIAEPILPIEFLWEV